MEDHDLKSTRRATSAKQVCTISLLNCQFYGPDENKEGSYQKCMHVLNFFMSLVAHRLFSTGKGS